MTSSTTDRAQYDANDPSNVSNQNNLTSADVMKYPFDIDYNNQYLVLNCFKYSQARTVSNSTPVPKTKQIGKIVLPVPVDLSTSYSAAYDQFSFVKAAGEAAKNIVSNDLVGGVKSAGSVILDDLISKINSGQFVANLFDVLPSFNAARGVIFNPRQEVGFNGMTFRTITLAYSMWARSPDDNTQIQKIIKFLKVNMHASYGTSDDIAATTIQYPSEFSFAIYPEAAMKYKFRFSDSFLVGFTHTINPNGPAYLKPEYDYAPLNHIIQMTFMENSILTRESIEQSYAAGKPF